MKEYTVIVREIYEFPVKIEANSKKEALQKSKEAYENALNTDWNGVFCPDANSHEKTLFKII